MDSRVSVALAQLSEETRCPVCFGIFKHTVASTVCLHRFCAACIDTCLSGRPPQHKECPVCRANLHSRRALRPDPNFDRLLRALYGDIGVYGQQEDALVAARNAAHAQEAAREAELRRAQRAAQEAAVAASNPHRGPSVARAGSGSVDGLARQASNNGSGNNKETKRARDAGTDGSAAAAGAPAAKRPHSESPAPQLLQRRLHHDTDAPPRASPPRLGRAAHPTGPGPAAAPAHRAPSRLALASPGPALASCTRSPSPPCHTARQWRSPQRSGAAAADATPAGQHGGSGNASMPRGPLAVPTARSAAELSLRHPGMVVVQLKPAHCFSGPGGPGNCPGGGSSGDGTESAASIGRTPRDRTPALEKPFLLCPVGWSVAHLAQLLSQWLPRRGYGPAAAPVPPADIRLEPAPGTLRSSHRCLRGCMPLGALLAELQGAEQAGAERGGRSSARSQLDLLYSIVPSQP